MKVVTIYFPTLYVNFVQSILFTEKFGKVKICKLDNRGQSEGPHAVDSVGLYFCYILLLPPLYSSHNIFHIQ